MKGRERLTRIYRSEVPDRIPFAPIIFDSTLSAYSSKIQEAGPLEFTKMISADVLWRTNASKIENDMLKLSIRKDQSFIFKEYQTKKGCLNTILRRGKFGSQRIEKWPIESLTDYTIIEHILDHQNAIPDTENILKADREVGDSGIIMIFQTTTPVQSLIQEWMGLKQFYSHLMRHTSDLENLMALMHEKNKEIYEVMAESQPKVQCIVENTDIRLTSPKIYQRYSLEHVKDFVKIMHRHNKIAIVHMCGKIKGLLPLIKQTGLDGIDCLTPAPTGDVDLKYTYQILGERSIIHGCLPPTKWLPPYLALDDIERNIKMFLKDTLYRPFVFVLAADGIPGIPIEKFKAITKIFQKHSNRQVEKK